MTANIKYIVKYHPRPIRKVARVLFTFTFLVFLLDYLVFLLFSQLPPDLQVFAILYFIPKIFSDLTNVALMVLLLGLALYAFKWRKGKIEITEDKLMIHGAYYVSIWLKNMWSVDVRDSQHLRRRIKLDSNVDAVHIKFRNQEEFKRFSESIINAVKQVENIKISTNL